VTLHKVIVFSSAAFKHIKSEMQEKLKYKDQLREKNSFYCRLDNEKSLPHMFDKNLTLLTVNILETVSYTFL